MSQIRANSIVNADANGPVNFPFGVTGITSISSASYADVAGIATNAINSSTALVATNAASADVATNAEGLTGTPDITVNNIIAVGATFSGDVSIGGTLSYEDVTNIDTIGIITANNGINVTSGGINVSGVVTATTFNGSGASLTTLNASELDSGTIPDGRFPATLPAISGVNLTGVESISTWTLGANGVDDYTFTGPGLTGAENDPTIYVSRGQTYNFVNNMGAHPFRIQTTPNGSAGTAYNDGITNNDVSNGTLEWDVQFDAPDTLYYQCTAHSNMGGIIYIGDQTRTLPNNAQSSAYTLISTDTGKLINITSGDVTVATSTFDIGSLTTIYNNKAGTMSITANGVTLRKAGTSDTGSLTIEQYGTASILCVANDEFVVSGNLS